MVFKIIVFLLSLVLSINSNQKNTYVLEQNEVLKDNEIKEEINEEKQEEKKETKQETKKKTNNNKKTTSKKTTSVVTKKEVKETAKKVDTNNKKVLATYKGTITAYGPDCKGCSGKTASGYNVKKTIYYNDKTYGKVRIVAADRLLPFGTIVRISNLSGFKEPIIAIVLDRGGAIGFNKKVYFDLLYPSEKASNSFGRKKATFEILRKGY